jgi:hypothetical protein
MQGLPPRIRGSIEIRSRSGFTLNLSRSVVGLLTILWVGQPIYLITTGIFQKPLDCPNRRPSRLLNRTNHEPICLGRLLGSPPMSEIVNNSFCSALVRCFSGLEARNINGLLLISFRRVSERIKTFYGSFGHSWAFYSGEQRDFSLFRDEKLRDSAAHGHSPAVFSLQ